MEAINVCFQCTKFNQMSTEAMHTVFVVSLVAFVCDGASLSISQILLHNCGVCVCDCESDVSVCGDCVCGVSGCVCL
jgi:hypothetical protein